ncbi:hypothetical protein GGR08_000522 [Bartonella fuyuanensis]|uniref:Uncharacterized protein n=1 Tax=Bartonella fuyuanensis TaxID=1460968 RepID=A0A840E378_9HYPH|nr:hypothetical protein [Bartonella fuyuanensis]
MPFYGEKAERDTLRTGFEGVHRGIPVECRQKLDEQFCYRLMS